MKVLHILNELKPSGAEVMLELAGPIWRDLGCSLHVTAFSEKAGAFCDRLRAANWEVSHVNRAGGILTQLVRLKSHIQAIAPDIVHLHQEGLSLPICFAVKSTGIPFVRTVHNNFPFTGSLRLRKTVERWIFRKLGGSFIAISPSVEETESVRFKNPTKLCWNWFDSSGFRQPTRTEKIQARQKLGIPENQIVLVSVGNGSDVKNYRLIVESIPMIDHAQIHYYQVGNRHPFGVDERIAHELGVENRVHFVGPSHDIQSWLWSCDLYVMPSIYEGFGLSAVEALASGCDCLFADCPGLVDFKLEGVVARWIDPSPLNFATEIKSAINAPMSQENLTKNSRIVRNGFDTKTRCTAYYEHWKHVIDLWR
jgi:glycosyltransferase involved in cell wall biosynthesis